MRATEPWNRVISNTAPPWNSQEPVYGYARKKAIGSISSMPTMSRRIP